MKKLTIYFVLCCLASAIIYSCTKTASPGGDTGNDTQSAYDNSLAESVNNDIAIISAQSEDNGVEGSYGDSAFSPALSPCATITIDLASNPQKLTIDFGEENCLCYDGKYRRGKILVAYTGLYRDPGSTHTIIFDNYYVNDYKVEGTHTIINTGRNGAGNLTFSVDINSTITDTTGRKLYYTSERTREWVAGESTDGLFEWTDDVYSITGTAEGTAFDGTKFTSDITSPLIVALDCRWIEKGTIEFKPAGELKRTLDFGNGGCDNKVTVSIAGFLIDILLP